MIHAGNIAVRHSAFHYWNATMPHATRFGGLVLGWMTVCGHLDRNRPTTILTWPPNSPDNRFGQLCFLESPSTDGLSTSTIHDNQPAEWTEAGDRHWLEQTVAAFGWSRQWSVIECVLQQQGGHIEHLMWKMRYVTVALNTNWENKQVVFCCSFLTKFTDIALFPTVAFKTLIFH